MKEITTKASFFRQLKKDLRFRYENNEVQSILSDYGEIFEIEMAKGHSESEICKSLGSPSLIVRNLDREMGKESGSKKKALAKMLIKNKYWIVIGLLAWMSVYITFNNYLFTCLLPEAAAEFIILIPVFSLLVWLQVKQQVPVHSGANSIMRQRIAHGICILVMLLVFTLAVSLRSEFTKQSWYFGLELWEVGPLVTRVLCICMVGLCGMILYGVNQQRTSMHYFTLMIHAVGSICVILYYINALANLDNLEGYSLHLWVMGGLYIETLILAALAGLYIKKKGMR